MDKNAIINSKSRTEWVNLIDEWVHNERAREMLKRRLLDGATIQQIADEFNLSLIQTQHILQKYKQQVLEHC